MEQYAIVRFKEQEENSKILDLVPISWVRGDENSRYTLYPEPCDYHHIEKWLSCSKEPEENWKSFAIEVIAYAEMCLGNEERNLEIADIPFLEETAAIEISNLSPNNDPVTKEYINHKFNELQEAISSQIASAKRSILYDLEKNINDIKHTLLFNSATGSSTLQDSIIQNFNSWRYNRKRQYR
ncbi:uncharacterized protein LOC114881595 isoform X2 [Osmia bicornis bicornis]|uniref:uncharacterized protein LOC114881595 isoform X2 n=1 Tax=Osmia bicornis bicornis TaxID=1437191 RepID=UPI001EAEAC69|nr:uncharacterized protein LOC114881595 isoform X2 [Osmia bicornis bicornis]